MAMKASEFLTQARNVIADLNKWTQGAFARDEAGNDVYTYDPNAVCWCSMGVLYYVDKQTRGIDTPTFGDAWNILLRVTPQNNVTAYNDSHTHAEVLALFDTAIEEVKKVEATI